MGYSHAKGAARVDSLGGYLILYGKRGNKLGRYVTPGEASESGGAVSARCMSIDVRYMV